MYIQVILLSEVFGVQPDSYLHGSRLKYTRNDAKFDRAYTLWIVYFILFIDWINVLVYNQLYKFELNRWTWMWKFMYIYTSRYDNTITCWTSTWILKRWVINVELELHTLFVAFFPWWCQFFLNFLNVPFESSAFGCCLCKFFFLTQLQKTENILM